ncbi:MAG: TerD family protein [Sulfurovum sp.]|nr:TerD family protein [Sulfurovum sp.]
MEDFIYFNNENTKSIQLLSGNKNATFTINMHSLSQNINKIPIIITADNSFNLSSLSFLEIRFNDNLVYELEGIREEKSIIIAELYERSNLWKYKIIAQGFNRGLEKIAVDFGLDLASLSQEEKNKNL